MADEPRQPTHKGVVMLTYSEVDIAHGPQQFNRLNSAPKSPVVMQFFPHLPVEYIAVSRPATPQIFHHGMGPKHGCCTCCTIMAITAYFCCGRLAGFEREAAFPHLICRDEKLSERKSEEKGSSYRRLGACCTLRIDCLRRRSRYRNLPPIQHILCSRNFTRLSNSTTEQSATSTASTTTTTSLPAASPTVAITQASRIFKPSSQNQGNMMSLALS
ncbi:hypothetical protein BJ742DRAFT_196970 [Cladochytrium replicatum]|nr:hypothetical protein BJ742DRAFT_196970 [Cladochytrium replicatum]